MEQLHTHNKVRILDISYFVISYLYKQSWQFISSLKKTLQSNMIRRLKQISLEEMISKHCLKLIKISQHFSRKVGRLNDKTTYLHYFTTNKMNGCCHVPLCYFSQE